MKPISVILCCFLTITRSCMVSGEISQGNYKILNCYSKLFKHKTTYIIFFLELLRPLNLGQYRWQNRIIVTSSSDESHPELIKLKEDISRNVCGFNNRNLKHLHVTDPNENFKIILIGKDGGTKFEDTRASLSNLFQIIDRMPMRRYEMKFDSC